MTILETERLRLREMTDADFAALAAFLQDPRVMYAYEGAHSDDEVRDWLRRNRERYSADGFGLWAVELKETGDVIGDCGLTRQATPSGEVLEIGYHLRYDYWHCGYATEAAIACKRYAFETLGAAEVYSIIRDSNTASMNVAIRNGMTVRGQFVKHYRGVDMPHFVFAVSKPEDDKTSTENW